MDINSEYIDLQDALKRLGGSLDLYKKLLKQFIAGNHIDPLEEALNTGELTEASQLTHALKGVSANLSLIMLSGCARKLEADVKSNNDFSDTFNDLKNAYQVTLKEISKII